MVVRCALLGAKRTLPEDEYYEFVEAIRGQVEEEELVDLLLNYVEEHQTGKS